MSPILAAIAPRVLGPAAMVAAAIVVKGYTDVGDGFSAGVIVALAIALRYVTIGPERTERSLPLLRYAPAVTAAGLLVALATGFFGIVAGDPPFTHLPAPGDAVTKVGRLEAITPVVFDVGLFLCVAGALTVLIHHLAWLVWGREA